MRYNDIVGVESFFDSTFNMTEERKDYWKQFISNDKFESNLMEIINAFDSEESTLHKSIWVQGTYGTGKSHSSSVIKHILSDDFDEIKDYVKTLKNSQLIAAIKKFRNHKKVFPVVLKGTNEIVDSKDMKHVIQNAVSSQLKAQGINISVKSDFEATISLIDDERFASFWNIELKNRLSRYHTDKNGLKRMLQAGDIDLLKEIDNALKENANFHTSTDNIVSWLTEVSEELRNQNIADYLVIFWDEFTSLLEITERRSILNTIQDIAELSHAPSPSNPSIETGVYVFLVTHKNMEATDSFRELKEDEKTMAKARFLQLKYDMQPITTYHILSNAIKVKDSTKVEELKHARIDENISIGETLDRIIDQTDSLTNAAVTKKTIKGLYPFHPYTAYLATFVSRAIGSAERSIFEFLNDGIKGFKKFIEQDINDDHFLTADYVWDFFIDSFAEDRTNHFDAILNKHNLFVESFKNKPDVYSKTFKIILLLNLLNRVIQSDDAFQESSLVNPSEKNILATLSGSYSSEEVAEALEFIDNSEIIQRNPEGIFEIATSNMPIQKIQSEKDKLYLKYSDISTVFSEYVGAKNDLKREITSRFYRDCEFDVFGAEISSLDRKCDKAFTRNYAVHVALIVFKGQCKELEKKKFAPEISSGELKNKVENTSSHDFHKDIIYVVVDSELGNKAFEGFIDSKAREVVAKGLQMPDEVENNRKKAEKWISKWKDEIVATSKVTIIFRGNRIDTTYKKVGTEIKEKVLSVQFNKALELNTSIRESSTAWPYKSAKTTIQNVCFALTKEELESKIAGAALAVKHLLKDTNSVDLFDNELNYIGSSNTNDPVVILFDAINSRIDACKSKTVIDLGEELSFLSQPPYGYYSNYVCMGAISLVLRQYIDKIYLADQGSVVNNVIMKDVILALFNYWEKGKKSNRLQLRFSTAEEQALIEIIKSIFHVDGDGIIDTKWKLRTSFEQKYHSPLWTLKYVEKKSSEFNQVIDALFEMVVTPNESIDRSKITLLLNGLKKFKVDIMTSMSKAENQSCLNDFIKSVLSKYKQTDLELDSVIEFLQQQLQEEIVYWSEIDTESKIKEYCLLAAGSSSLGTDIEYEDTNSGEQDDATGSEFASDAPEFEPLVLTPISTTGRVHNTIESATSAIEATSFSDRRTKKILVSLCNEYPVVCDKIIDLLKGEDDE